MTQNHPAFLPRPPVSTLLSWEDGFVEPPHYRTVDLVAQCWHVASLEFA